MVYTNDGRIVFQKLFLLTVVNMWISLSSPMSSDTIPRASIFLRVT